MLTDTTLSYSASDEDFFDSIQFPIQYTFPQDPNTGVFNRNFEQSAFRNSANLQNKAFSLVNPNTGKALSMSEPYELRTDLHGANCP